MPPHLERKPELSDLYTYVAYLKRVKDGDTIVVDVDCGLYNWEHDAVIRLGLVDAIELDDEGGIEAMEHLSMLLEDAGALLIRTYKDRQGRDIHDSWHRWIAEVWVDDVCINDRMVADGFATTWTRERKR